MSRAMRLPGKRQRNQRAELIAIEKAIEMTPNEHNLTIMSDSMYALKSIHEQGRKNEDKGWFGVEHSDVIRKILYLLDKRGSTTHLQWIKGHNNDRGNEEADRLAKEGAEKTDQDEI